MLYPPNPNDSMSMQRHISVFYHPSATTDDMLRSVLQSACLRRLLGSSTTPESQIVPEKDTDSDLDTLYAALEKSSRWTHRHFDEFKGRLEAQGWRTDEIAFADRGRRVLWGSAAHRAL